MSAIVYAIRSMIDDDELLRDAYRRAQEFVNRVSRLHCLAAWWARFSLACSSMRALVAWGNANGMTMASEVAAKR